MNIKARKYKLIEEFIHEVNEENIDHYEVVLNQLKTEKKSYDNISPIYHELINQGLQQSQNGQTIPHEEVMKTTKQKIKFL